MERSGPWNPSPAPHWNPPDSLAPLQKWRRFAPLVESLRSISDEMYTVLLALPSGNEDFRRNVAEKSVWGVRKTLKFIETSVKNENMHEIGREKTFSRFD